MKSLKPMSGNFNAKIYETVRGATNKIKATVNESSLEGKISELLNTNFKNASEDSSTKLIQKIIDLSIAQQLKDYQSLETKVNVQKLKNNINESSKDFLKQGLDVIKEVHEEYLKWAEGDAKKIYKVLKEHASQNENGRLTTNNITELESNSLVWNFLCMIDAYIEKFFRIGDPENVQKANDKREAGPFMAKLAKSKGGQKISK